MTFIETTVPDVLISGLADERFFAPGRPDTFWSRSRFVALLGIVLVVHAAVIGYFLYRDATVPAALAQAEETAIEVVVEPPPPPPPQKPPAPEPQPKQEMSEKPASSAPRAPSEIHVDTKMTDAKTEAPKAAIPPRDGQPEPASAAAAEQPAAPESKQAAASKLEDDERDAEALDKAKPNVESKPDAQDAKVKPKTQVSDAARQLSGLSDVPTYHFATASKMADFPAGTEDNRYLSVVYGKIMSKNRYRTSAAARRGAHGIVSVTFVVDFMGRIARQVVTESSGQPDLDALAMATVRAAAPFPSPPGSGSQQLIWRAEFER